MMNLNATMDRQCVNELSQRVIFFDEKRFAVEISRLFIQFVDSTHGYSNYIAM